MCLKFKLHMFVQAIFHRQPNLKTQSGRLSLCQPVQQRDMPNLVVKDSVGASGGLALFWKKNVNLTVKSLSKYHIDAVVREEDGFEWRFTGMYGEPKSEEKDRT